MVLDMVPLVDGLRSTDDGKTIASWLATPESTLSRRPSTALELPAVLPRPALDHNLLIGVELDGIVALGMHSSEEALFPAAEGKVGHGRGHSDVDADVARRRLVAELASRRAAGGEQRGLVAVGAARQESERLVNVASRHEAQHGPKNFRIGQRTVLAHAIEHGRPYKIA